MESLEELKKVVASNLIFYRKSAKLTQAEVAEKLNYSDKAVSKWERGETIPDAYILKQLAQMYYVSVDDLLDKSERKRRIPFAVKKAFKNKKMLITLLSCGLVWLVATIVFVSLILFTNLNGYAYLSFIYAIPLTCILGIIFSSIWSKSWVVGIFVSCLIWSIILSLFLTINSINLSLLFIIGAPLQILVILWYFLITENTKIKWHLKRSKISDDKKNDDN
ncbi:MAG: helix-turn-helix domain-containing protein [Clostridiales bacterium]|nr:helix-turn-helix domain-containing protein [Candidatus Apopatousia equi]